MANIDQATGPAVSYQSDDQKMSIGRDGSMSYDGPSISIKAVQPAPTRDTTVVEDVVSPFGPDQVPDTKPDD